MKSRLGAVLIMTAFFSGCAGGSPSIPSVAQSGTPASLVQQPVKKPATAGVNSATDLFVDDGGAMKLYSASASGAASYDTIIMPSTFNYSTQFNGLGGDEFAVTHGTCEAINFFYVDSIAGTLTWCATPEIYLKGHSINGSSCAVKATLTDTADLQTGNESPDNVDVVWDNAAGLLATLNSDTGRIATYSANASNSTLSLVAKMTFPKPVQMMKMAADPLFGDLWVINGDTLDPYLVTVTASSVALYEQAGFAAYGPSDDIASAFDVNDNEEMWVGNIGGSLYETAETGASAAYEPGQYCSQLSNVTGLASDSSNVYALGWGNLIEVYSDGVGPGCVQPSRTITGLANPLAIAIL